MSLLQEYRLRVFWLLLGLGGSFFIARIIGYYEKLISQYLFLAAYIPMIVYISDAVGTQMESVIIRAISTDKKFIFQSFLVKQFLLTILVGFTIFIIALPTITLIHNSAKVGLAVSVGVLGGILSSLLSGTIIPYYFWRFHQDPAEASGPIATIIQDTLSIIVFFFAASVILS